MNLVRELKSFCLFIYSEKPNLSKEERFGLHKFYLKTDYFFTNSLDEVDLYPLALIK